jgi:hypothetical protein
MKRSKFSDEQILAIVRDGRPAAAGLEDVGAAGEIFAQLHDRSKLDTGTTAERQRTSTMNVGPNGTRPVTFVTRPSCSTSCPPPAGGRFARRDGWQD